MESAQTSHHKEEGAILVGADRHGGTGPLGQALQISNAQTQGCADVGGNGQGHDGDYCRGAVFSVSFPPPPAFARRGTIGEYGIDAIFGRGSGGDDSEVPVKEEGASAGQPVLQNLGGSPWSGPKHVAGHVQRLHEGWSLP